MFFFGCRQFGTAEDEGFQIKMRLCLPQCRILTRGLATLVCDPVSYEFVRGSTIDYTTDIIRSAFEVRPTGNFLQPCIVRSCSVVAV